MSVKSPLGLVLYCYLNMPTINKTYLVLSYLNYISLYDIDLKKTLFKIKEFYFCKELYFRLSGCKGEHLKNNILKTSHGMQLYL